MVPKSKFYRLWQAWKRLARKIGDAQARIILTVFYFLIVGPFALVIRFWSDPLRLNSRDSTGWIRTPDTDESGEKRGHEQF
jgi:hypothetical protein